jgi:dTDP-4-amino-4,6-dideoxygalactose transaminase
VPYRDDEVDVSSCYVMPVLLDDGGSRDAVRQGMLEHHGVQTTVLYPAIHEFSAYLEGQRALPKAEAVARSQLTLPLYPHLSEDDQDRVVEALAQSLAAGQ